MEEEDSREFRLRGSLSSGSIPVLHQSHLSLYLWTVLVASGVLYLGVQLPLFFLASIVLFLEENWADGKMASGGRDGKMAAGGDMFLRGGRSPPMDFH